MHSREIVKQNSVRLESVSKLVVLLGVGSIARALPMMSIALHIDAQRCVRCNWDPQTERYTLLVDIQCSAPGS